MRPVKEILTPSEIEVITGMGLGKMLGEIAKERGVGYNTVDKQRQSAYKKLGITCVAEAVHFAVRSGLVGLFEFECLDDRPAMPPGDSPAAV